MTEDVIDRALWYAKWFFVGVFLIFAMMFIAFPIGIAILFGWETFITTLSDAIREGSQ